MVHITQADLDRYSAIRGGHVSFALSVIEPLGFSQQDGESELDVLNRFFEQHHPDFRLSPSAFNDFFGTLSSEIDTRYEAAYGGHGSRMSSVFMDHPNNNTGIWSSFWTSLGSGVGILDGERDYSPLSLDQDPQEVIDVVLQQLGEEVGGSPSAPSVAQEAQNAATRLAHIAYFQSLGVLYTPDAIARIEDDEQRERQAAEAEDLERLTQDGVITDPLPEGWLRDTYRGRTVRSLFNAEHSEAIRQAAYDHIMRDGEITEAERLAWDTLIEEDGLTLEVFGERLEVLDVVLQPSLEIADLRPPVMDGPSEVDRGPPEPPVVDDVGGPTAPVLHQEVLETSGVVYAPPPSLEDISVPPPPELSGSFEAPRDHGVTYV